MSDLKNMFVCVESHSTLMEPGESHSCTVKQGAPRLRTMSFTHHYGYIEEDGVRDPKKSHPFSTSAGFRALASCYNIFFLIFKFHQLFFPT